MKQPKTEETQDGKNIKTSELHECPDCHKMLTYRTLKYSHPSVCPAKNPPAEKKPKQKVVEIQDVEVRAPQQIKEHKPYERRINAIIERQEKMKNLAAMAF